MNLNATIVHIIVTGLIAMQQVTDVQTGLVTAGWRIAAPALHSGSATIEPLHPHQPLIAVRRGAISGPEPQMPPLNLEAKGHGSSRHAPALAAWDITGAKVTFSPAGKATNPVLIPQTLLNMKDLCVTDRCRQMNPSLKVGNGLAFEAWVDSAAAVSTWIDPTLKRVIFRSSPEKDLGAITEEVCLIFEIPDEILTVTLDFGTKKIIMPLLASDGRIDLILANAPAPKDPDAPDPGHAEHIKYYYGMSRGLTSSDSAFLLNQKGPQLPVIKSHSHPTGFKILIPNSSDCPPTGGWDTWP